MAKSKDDNLDDPNPGNKTKAAGTAAVEDSQVNSIQFASTDADSSSRNPKRGKKTRNEVQNAVESTAKDKSGESRSSRVPDSVHERFIQIGNNLFFPDGAEAFSRDHNRLTTRSENAIVIQSMVAIAREESERGVVKVAGSDFFKKEAWFAASLAGLHVEGYTPSEFERERLVRAIAARRGVQPTEKELQPQDERKATAKPDEFEFITGKLVDHGPAPYKHKPKEPMSYFVRIETEKGDRDIWGVDLERAFRQSLSNPGIGDEVGIRALGKEAVTVQAEGRELATHRNHWSVERMEFLGQRRDMATVFRDPTINADEGIKRHSGLEGSYRKLEMGQALADEQYSSTMHRRQFVDHLRAHLAKDIEYGQPLEPVGQRAREERTRNLSEPDRDYDPTR